MRLLSKRPSLPDGAARGAPFPQLKDATQVWVPISWQVKATSQACYACKWALYLPEKSVHPPARTCMGPSHVSLRRPRFLPSLSFMSESAHNLPVLLSGIVFPA